MHVAAFHRCCDQGRHANDMQEVPQTKTIHIQLRQETCTRTHNTQKHSAIQHNMHAKKRHNG